ncbi:hypothetical protein B0T25DRAFT_493067 [Lasiosphaeria hispida]|uniref:Protein kinase domain-containing protein n=1 Tax=Lasiosphaeria hispida TaxID=260671 RepID=A0AAJ0MKY0_9PEZI|nr:hypothetical protein B0T25DRAFT_493067 [Lasiosphaeria hispida]
MATPNSNILQDLLRRLAETERRLEEERLKREDAERRAERLRLSAESKRQPTSFLAFLYYTHKLLFEPLQIQTNPSLASTGGFTSVHGRYYPLELRRWTEFEVLHRRHFSTFSSTFGDQSLFHSLDVIMTVLRNESPSPLAAEDDLRPFEMNAVEQRVKNVMDKFFKLLPGPIRRVIFRSNPYSLEKVEAGPALRDSQPSPSKRLSPERKRINPDRWCIQVNDEGVRIPLFVVEYKAGHKLTPTLLQEALDQDSPDRTIFPDAVRHAAASKQASRNSTAQILTQVFHYMIDCGLQYSYITSGEGFIFLNINPTDPKILYYHLFFPKKKVHLPRSSDEELIDAATLDTYRETLMNTAIAQVLTLVCLALDRQPLNQAAKQAMQADLAQWPIPYPGQDPMPVEDAVSDRPELPQPATTLSDTSSRHQDPTKKHPRPDEDDEHGGGPSAAGPSTSTAIPQRTRDQSRKQRLPLTHFCTQKCLLGLKRNGELDENCPNIHRHRAAVGTKDSRHHPITIEIFSCLLHDQLAVDLDSDCEALDKYGKFGAIGVLFKITLHGYGYTVVAKGVQRVDRNSLKHETAVYARLDELQGDIIPVWLGQLDLAVNYILSSGAHICTMMLMSYAGEPVQAENWDTAVDYSVWGGCSGLGELLSTLEACGVYHHDVRRPNTVWNEEVGRPMIIDFDRAVLVARKAKRQLSEDLELELELELERGRERESKRRVDGIAV